MTHKNRKKSRIFMFLSTGCSLVRPYPVDWAMHSLLRPRDKLIAIFDQENIN
jgi:hypothetical protein